MASSALACTTTIELVSQYTTRARRIGGLGDLVHVALGWQARADVEELPDPRVLGQVPDRPAQERAGWPALLSQPPAPPPAVHRPASRSGGEVILPAEQPVVDPRDVRDGDI